MSFSFLEVLGTIGLLWGCVVFTVQVIGIVKIFRYYSFISTQPTSPTLPKNEVPHIDIIRPASGLEPGLYECLASTFQQTYPKDKLTLSFCVASREDPAFPILEQLLRDFPDSDARIFVESEDPFLYGPRGNVNNVGPNPKIRNVSRAYREAKGDVIWAIDCNIWVANQVAGNMVDKLYGYGPRGSRNAPYKLVHQLPLVVDTVSSMTHVNAEGEALLSGNSVTGSLDAQSSVGVSSSWISRWLTHGGGRLEEMFMATTHAKFYGAINTVQVAPCIVGKSNMFRRAHLEQVTDPDRNPILSGTAATLPKGIDHFSPYMCEDHIIGDLMWRSDLHGFKNHGMVADLCIQPMAGMSVKAYVARRVRWLRARKWTVLAATLVEHGIESLICCFYVSFGLTTVAPVRDSLGLGSAWRDTFIYWFIGLVTWVVVDRVVFTKLHAGQSIIVDENTPRFAKGTCRGGAERRSWGEWMLAWLGREILAFPIWTWALFLGTSVNWRGHHFKVRSDMTVVPVDASNVDGEGGNSYGGRIRLDDGAQGHGSGVDNANGTPAPRKKGR